MRLARGRCRACGTSCSSTPRRGRVCKAHGASAPRVASQLWRIRTGREFRGAGLCRSRGAKERTPHSIPSPPRGGGLGGAPGVCFGRGGGGDNKGGGGAGKGDRGGGGRHEAGFLAASDDHPPRRRARRPPKPDRVDASNGGPADPPQVR